MTRATDSHRPRRTRRQCTAAALALLASVGWVRQVSAADPHSGGAAGSGTIGAGPVWALAIDPDTPTTVYAGTQCAGVLKSLDGGDSWEVVNAGLPHDVPGGFKGVTVAALAIDPMTPTTLYAGTDDGVFKSLNGGNSWSAANTGLPDVRVQVLAIDPAAPTTLYAGRYDGVFRSLNGGSSWQATSLTGSFVAALAINPVTPTTLYAGTDDGLFRSLNGGSGWSAVNTGLPDFSVGRALAIDPTVPTTLYAGTDAAGPGVFRSVNGGSSWTAVNTGLPDSAVILALVIDPTTPTTLYAGTWGIWPSMGGVFGSLNGGSTWEATSLTNHDIGALVIDPATPTTLYAGTGKDGLFRSRNGGSSWQATGVGPEVCGDGVAGCDEACEDGNLVDGDGCDSNCTPTACGNGIISAGEECDDHNESNGDGCSATCTIEAGWSCSRLWGCRTTCGDAIRAGDEACDDGGESATCDADCTVPQCGDGTLNVTAGEECDDGDSFPLNSCDTTCRRTFCGDAIVQLGEQCDDGNTASGDGCDSNCTPTACGNGVVSAGERCDDANRNPFDGCTTDCTVCGDGTVTPPEECDDGNTSSGDGCDAQCRRPRIVGTGTPQSCTEVAFDAALTQRSVHFNCGSAPVTITLTSEKTITAATTVDGGGLVTLSGGGGVRIVRVTSGAALEVRHLTIADGYATRGDGAYGGSYGGGILNEGVLSPIDKPGTLIVIDTTFLGNSADAAGAIVNFGTVSVTNGTFSGNRGGSGSAIHNQGQLTMTNSTLSGNRGVALVQSGTARLTNCTLSENGGAISNEGCFSGDGMPCGARGSVTLTNTIIAESAAPSCPPGTEPITDGGHNLQFPGTSCGATIPSRDPRLDPDGLKDNGGPTWTIALLPGSPAINAGDPNVCANPPVNGVDQRGYARPGTGHTQCSIGAYEYNSPGPPAGCVGDCNHNGAATITELVTLVNIALGTTSVAECSSGDANGNGAISIDEIIRAVNAALSGCDGG